MNRSTNSFATQAVELTVVAVVRPIMGDTTAC
jgi:hypothetical protein